MQLCHYLALLQRSEDRFASAFRAVAGAHGEDAEIRRGCLRFAGQCEDHVERLTRFVEKYGRDAAAPPPDLHADLFDGPRDGPFGLLRDLHDLYLMAAECDIVWTLVGQAAQGARDPDLLDTVHQCEGAAAIQMRWAKGQMKQAAPQTLVVARERVRDHPHGSSVAGDACDGVGVGTGRGSRPPATQETD